MLGLVQPGAVQRLRALARDREQRRPPGGVDDRQLVAEVQPDRADGVAADDQRQRHLARQRGRPVGEAAVAPRPSRPAAHPDRLPGADGVGEGVRRVQRQPAVDGGVGRAQHPQVLRRPRGPHHQHRRAGAQLHGVGEHDPGDLGGRGRPGQRGDDAPELLRRGPALGLGDEQPGPAQGHCGLLDQRHHRRPLVPVEAALLLEADRDDAEAPPAGEQRQAVDAGVAVLPHHRQQPREVPAPVVLGLHPDRLAPHGGRPGGRHRVDGQAGPQRPDARAPAAEVELLEQVLAVLLPHGHGRRAQEPPEPLHHRRRDLPGGGGGGQRGRGRLELPRPPQLRSPVRGTGQDAQHPVAAAPDGAAGDGGARLLRAPVAVHHERHVLGDRGPTGPGRVDERGDRGPRTGPDPRERRAERGGVLVAEERDARVVVEQPQVLAPREEHRHRRPQHDVRRGAQPRGPRPGRAPRMRTSDGSGGPPAAR